MKLFAVFLAFLLGGSPTVIGQLVYDYTTGPQGQDWCSGVSDLCCEGDHPRQSPIRLDDVTPDTSFSLAALKMYPSMYNTDAAGTLENDGKGAKWTPSSGVDLLVSGGPFAQGADGPFDYAAAPTDEGVSAVECGGGTYKLDHVQLHWGDKKTRGGEHILPGLSEGERPVAELQLVHVNVRYADYDEAVTKSDGLLSMAISFQHDASADNTFLQALDDAATNIETSGTTTALTLNLGDLFAMVDTSQYYTYMGSITTPPCTGSVTWIVFKTLVPANGAKNKNGNLQSLRALTNSDGANSSNNFRGTTKLRGRTVYGTA